MIWFSKLFDDSDEEDDISKEIKMFARNSVSSMKMHIIDVYTQFRKSFTQPLKKNYLV